MKIKLLPSTFDEFGRASLEQRLSCYLIDDCVCIDAGSIALGLTDEQRTIVRDIVITHAHIDHVATLPILIDDLFASLYEPVRVHATAETIARLEHDLFNWHLYPRFSELDNGRCRVMEYVPFEVGTEFYVRHLRLNAIEVEHAVPTVGLVVSDAETTIAFSADTKETQAFWRLLNHTPNLRALLIEASFPNEFREIAEASGHLTPASLKSELQKLNGCQADILAVHLKPAYRDILVRELGDLEIAKLSAMEPGREYSW